MLSRVLIFYVCIYNVSEAISLLLKTKHISVVQQDFPYRILSEVQSDSHFLLVLVTSVCGLS